MVDFFGFDGNDVGFDQGIFFAQVTDLEDVSQSQSIDTVNIEQNQIITNNNLNQSNEIDNVIIEQTHDIACNNINQSQEIDNVDIIFQPVHDIEIDNLNQSTRIDRSEIMAEDLIDVTNNGDLLEGKPRGSVTINYIVDAINQLIQDELVDGAENLEKQTSILTATGIWLDRIGARFLFERPLVFADNGNWFGFDGNGRGFNQAPFTPGVDEGVPIADAPYRRLIILRGGQLITDCSIPSMDATIDAAFQTGHYIDNADMTLDVILDTTLPPEIIVYTVEAGFITKPAGVRINNILITDLNGSFGFDGNGVGFDQGPFAQPYSEISP